MNHKNAFRAVFSLMGCLLATGAALAQAGPLDRLVNAYPAFLESHDATTIRWKDGASMPVSDGRANKSFEEKLKNPSLLDQMELTYVKGPLAKPPGQEDDPGRFRNTAFFDKMYGDCSKGQVAKKLVKVAWLPKSGGGSVMITSVNGVAEQLRAVSADLDALTPDLSVRPKRS